MTFETILKKFITVSMQIYNVLKQALFKMIEIIMIIIKGDKRKSKNRRIPHIVHMDTDDDPNDDNDIENFYEVADDDDDYYNVSSNEDIEKDIERNLIQPLVRDNKVTLMISSKLSRIIPLTLVTIDDNKNLNIIRNKEMVVGICVATVLGRKLEVTCNHALNLMTMLEIKKYISINPQLVVRASHINDVAMKWSVRPKDPVEWFTYDLETSKHVYTETQVIKPINAMIMRNGRQIITTIAIVVSTSYDENLLTSGTLMKCKDYPFIVTHIVSFKDINIKVLTAVAIFSHNYNIEYKLV